MNERTQSKGNQKQITGLDQFRLVLKEYRNLSLWAAGGTVILPFVMQFVGVIPPWPEGLNVMTAIFQLIALVYVYQKYFGQDRAQVTKGIERTLLILGIVFAVYIVLFITFVIPHPRLDVAYTRGFVCDAEALKSNLTKERCPWLRFDDIYNSKSDVFKLWTELSIGVVRAALITAWMSIFICLALVLGRFLTFQVNEKIEATQPAEGE